jgi:tetratricopeptide (TPR) repeat protein
LLFGLVIAAYSNHFGNAFHFDDAHTIVNNTSIRSLGNVPAFFRDATTFSSLPTNQSYRPLVSTLLAFDYWLGHGLNPFWFHLTSFFFYLLLLVLFAYVLRQFLVRADQAYSHAPALQHWWIVLAAVALYALHPANADTVNYIIGSAEIISSVGVIASFALYFAFPRTRRFYLFVAPAAICILAKPPAAIFAVLFAIYRLLFPPNAERRATTRLSAIRAWAIEVVPPLLICAILVGFVQHMTPQTWIAGARNNQEYLMTQPYVLWRYLCTFLWPSDLSADSDLDPFHSTAQALFWFGLLFLAGFVSAAIGLCFARRMRLIGFGLLWFVIGLLPTSLFPLAEVMNDHRPFIAYPGLIIALAGAAQWCWRALGERARRPTAIAAAILAGLIVCGSAYATFERNKVWRDEATLWRDVTFKSPRNGRGLMNYGLTLMGKGDYQGALDYYRRALKFTPQYPFLFVNFAIAEDNLGQTKPAENHFREALRLGPGLPDTYSFYARFLIKHGRQGEAQPLLRKAAELSPRDEMVRDLLTEASVFRAENYLNESLRLYRERHFDEAIAAARQALELRPGYAEAWNNIGAAYNSLGQFEEGARACQEALRLRPDFALARNNLKFAEEHLSSSAKPNQ